MDEGYVRPEQFLLSVVTSVLIGLLMVASRRPSETQGRYTMAHLQEIVGYSEEDLATALKVMESNINFGEKARITICTEGMPTEEELDYIFLGMVETGCHVSQPTARLIDGIPTTEFDLQKGSPQWQVIIPVLVPLFTIGLIVFGVTRIEAISKALVPLILITVGGLIILAVVLRKPAERYLERGGAIPRLATTKKALAAK